MSSFSTAFTSFRASLDQLTGLKVKNETSRRSAFQALLQTLAQEAQLTLVTEQVMEGTRIRPDGTLRDIFNLPRGYWESKDTEDDLETEIKKKRNKGYSFRNILFEDSEKAVLFQNQQRIFDASLTDADATERILHQFLTYEEPDPTNFEYAILRFGEIIPDLAKGLIERITQERADNQKFSAAFEQLLDLCRATLNPQIRPEVVIEMLAQHLLTERLFRTIFENPDFVRRNIIALEVEQTISVMVGRQFNRSDFTKTLDKYYHPIESRAQEATGWEQKQTFLNDLYEKFFQDFSKKAADTQGIVYTPQPIVNFMLSSVESLLQTEFGKGLADKGVTVLDPCVGTGNFMQALIRRLSPSTLEYKYKNELFCNENMLLPYYIASLNIEHAYFERAGEYLPFPGLCFTDTLMLQNTFADKETTGALDLFSAENAERIKAQQDATITVIIGNPPYNVGQMSENENNKNRRYPWVDARLSETYAKSSKATNLNKLSDPYVKFFRWATDRMKDKEGDEVDGVVAYISNNSFIDQISFDGMRNHLSSDFDKIIHLDMHGNVRKNPKISGTVHNVFGIQVGVGITLLVRNRKSRTGNCQIFYHRLPENWTGQEKNTYLNTTKSIEGVSWRHLEPNSSHRWLTDGMDESFDTLMPLGIKDAKNEPLSQQPLFALYSLGVSTHRDSIVYNFDKDKLVHNVKSLILNYNNEVDRLSTSMLSYKEQTKEHIDNFVDYTGVKWSESLKSNLKRGRTSEFDENKVREAMYRPFAKQLLYFDAVLNERRYQLPYIFPTSESQRET